MHRGCLPNGGARGEDFARNEIPHPCCVLYLSAKVWFLFEIAIDRLFTRLFLLAEIDNFTAEEKKQYYKSLENMGDYQNIINTAVEEALMRGLADGRAEGMEKGMEKGAEKERLANAAKMKELGVEVSIICQVTGLTIEEIEKL